MTHTNLPEEIDVHSSTPWVEYIALTIIGIAIAIVIAENIGLTDAFLAYVGA